MSDVGSHGLPTDSQKSIFSTSADYVSPFGNWVAKREEAEEAIKKTSAYFLNQDIYVYQFIDWQALQKNIRHIRNIFFKALNTTGGASSLDIQRISGFISYKNNTYLKKKLVGGQDYTTKELDEIVQVFIKNISTVHQIYQKENPAFDVPLFFRPEPELAGITAVYAKNNRIARWIVQYDFTLPFATSGRGMRAKVKDSLFEVEIDTLGRIIRILLRWKPIARKINSRLLNHESIPEILDGENHHMDLSTFIHSQYSSQDHDHETHSDGTEPIVEYQLAGDNSFQTHLAPFLAIPSGHHKEQISIVNHSLKISFVKLSSSSHVKIIADISGGSGNYSYSWACWEVAHRENFLNLGNQEYCTVFGGAFHVILTLIDLKYRMVKQFQELVYATQPTQLQFPRTKKLMRYGCTDPKAKNYDPNANCDDGSCTY